MHFTRDYLGYLSILVEMHWNYKAIFELHCGNHELFSTNNFFGMEGFASSEGAWPNISFEHNSIIKNGKFRVMKYPTLSTLLSILLIACSCNNSHLNTASPFQGTWKLD